MLPVIKDQITAVPSIQPTIYAVQLLFRNVFKVAILLEGSGLDPSADKVSTVSAIRCQLLDVVFFHAVTASLGVRVIVAAECAAVNASKTESIHVSPFRACKRAVIRSGCRPRSYRALPFP